MCTSPNIPERRKTPPLRGRLVKWEYTNAVSKITLSVCLADDGIVRVTYFTGPVPEDEPSYAVSPGYSAPGAEVREYDEAGVHVIETSLLRIRIRTEEQKVDFYDIVTDEPLLADEGGFGRESKDWTGDARVWIRKRLQDTEHFFGLGDKPCALNLRGKYFSMWGADHYDFHEESDPLYKSVPFFLSLREGQAYGLLFDNTCRSYFDFGASDEKVLAFGSFGGLMNYYFIYDRSPLDIVAAYTRLTGTPELPPLWALGYHQSKWSYYPDKAVYNLVERFRDLGIPCDAVHLDHHYMEQKEGFTWDRHNFPDAAGMVRSLEEDGVKTVLIVNPGVKINPANPVWAEGLERNYFCRRSEGNLLSEEVWPGLCNFPDFTAPAVRSWWADLFRHDLEEVGVRGLWNDMNEPVVFPDRTFPMDTRHEYDGMPCSHEKAHNIYGQCMAEASWLGMKRHAPDRRPFLLSRSGFAGLQRFAATWTGDNRSSWEHLKLANFQCQRLAASGISFAGADAGGFMGHPTPELFCRWMQMAAFHGLFRNHSSGEFGGQEPWVFGQEATAYVKAAIEGRYRLLPYIYTQFRRYAETGMPVLRSLALQCFRNRDTYWRGAEYFFGDHLYVIPIHEPQEGGRFLYIPEGVWYSYHTDSLMEDTGKDVWVKCPLSFLPVYVRGGAVIPHWPVQQHAGELPRPPLTLDVWWAPDEEVASHLYEDAGDGYAYRNGECAVHEFLYRGTGSHSLELANFSSRHSCVRVEEATTPPPVQSASRRPCQYMDRMPTRQKKSPSSRNPNGAPKWDGQRSRERQSSNWESVFSVRGWDPRAGVGWSSRIQWSGGSSSSASRVR